MLCNFKKTWDQKDEIELNKYSYSIITDYNLFNELVKLIKIKNTYFYDDNHETIRIILKCTDPIIKKGKISYYRTLENRNNKIRTPIKIGKFITAIFPKLNQQEIHEIAEAIKEQFILDVNNLIFKTGSSRKDFKNVFGGKVAKSSANTHVFLRSSCLQKPFHKEDGYNGVHPCEMYASGDFVMMWLEDGEGSIHARTIVCISPESDSVKLRQTYNCSQIFSVSIVSHNKLKSLATEHVNLNYGEKLHWDGARNNNWAGAKILRLPNFRNESDVIIGSYTDYGGDYVFDEQEPDKYLKIVKHGENHDVYRNNSVINGCRFVGTMKIIKNPYPDIECHIKVNKKENA